MRLTISALLALLAAPAAVVVGFLADATTDTAGNVPSIATLVVQLGLSGVFLWQWQSERKERAVAQDQLREFLEKFAPVLSEAVSVLQDVKAGLVSTVERVQIAPDRNTYDLALRRMEHLTDEMGELLRDREGRRHDR